MAEEFYGRVLEGLMKSVEFKSMFRTELISLFQKLEFTSVFRAEITNFCQSPQFRDIIRAEVQTAMKDLWMIPEVGKQGGMSYPDRTKRKRHIEEEAAIEPEEVADLDASINKLRVWKADHDARSLAETKNRTTPEINLSPVHELYVPEPIIGRETTLTSEGTLPSLKAILDEAFEKWTAHIGTTSEHEKKPFINLGASRERIRTDQSPSVQGISPWGMSLTKIFKECRNRGLLRSLTPFVPCDEKDIPRFCSYHVELGHHTNNCHELRERIVRLIREGKLNNLAIGSVQDNKQRKLHY